MTDDLRPVGGGGHGTLTATAPVPERAFDAYRDLDGLPPNFTPMSFDAAEADPAWHVDHRSRALASEPPGPPAPGGPFEVARDVLTDYGFADPRLVRAVYDPAEPLDGREMLLVGRFLGLRLHMPVRVGGVVDGPTQIDGREVHRFGWYYRTLQGHLERGHMSYEVLKWHDTGTVDFRLHAYSQRADDVHPVLRLGMAVFGRMLQLRFYDRTLELMGQLVDERT